MNFFILANVPGGVRCWHQGKLSEGYMISLYYLCNYFGDPKLFQIKKPKNNLYSSCLRAGVAKIWTCLGRLAVGPTLSVNILEHSKPFAFFNILSPNPHLIPGKLCSSPSSWYFSSFIFFSFSMHFLSPRSVWGGLGPSTPPSMGPAEFIRLDQALGPPGINQQPNLTPPGLGSRRPRMEASGGPDHA